MKQSIQMVLLLLRILTTGGVIGGLTVLVHTIEPSQARAAESADVYISASVIGGFPEIQGMNIAGREISSSNAYKSVGGGFKVGIFPQVTQRMLGIELEYFGTTGRLSSSNSSGTEGKAGLTVLNSMFNIVLRRPSGEILPYGGFGLGYSGVILHGADFPGRSNQDFDSTSGFSYQFMGGLQWKVSEGAFLFAEYKHLVADLHWKALSLDYRANYGLVGVGLSF
jgi:opacity protein-like surface antigen